MMDWEIMMIMNENEGLKEKNERLKWELDMTKKSLRRYQDEEDYIDIKDMSQYEYDYKDSKEFDEQLTRIRKKQRIMVKNKEAVVCDTEWEINGSISQGRKLTKDICKLALDSFDDFCDNLIIKLRYSGIQTVKEKILKKYQNINKLLISFNSEISGKYVDLKFEEANLKCKWLMKKEEEKEEIRRREQEIKEQLKLEEEINKAKEKIQYEQTQFNTEIARLQEQLANEQGNKKTIMNQLKKLQDKLAKLEEKKKDVLNRQINKKAGWVYCISNPSLDGMVKLGVTRRLNPMDRVNELGSASVPFKFGVHSIIFSEDAFKLEHDLHMAFDNYRVNKVNKQKEFFAVTLDMVKEEVLKHNPTATFIDNVVVDEYELSKEMA